MTHDCSRVITFYYSLIVHLKRPNCYIIGRCYLIVLYYIIGYYYRHFCGISYNKMTPFQSIHQLNT